MLLGVSALAVLGCNSDQPPVNTSNTPQKVLAGKSTPEKGERVPGEYIVGLKGGDVDKVLEVFAGFAPSIKKDMGRGRFLIKLADDPGPEAVAERVATIPSVRYAEPNRVVGIPTPVNSSGQLERLPQAD